MNTLPTKPDAPGPSGPPDELDKLLSDFFKAQLRHPWPNAPLPPTPAVEPAELVAARAGGGPPSAPARPAMGRNAAARARFTLAASVALMLGTCWYVSDGVTPGPRPGGAPGQSGGGFRLQNGDAKGQPGGVLDQMSKDKAGQYTAPVVDPVTKSGDKTGPKIDMGKIE